jgi:hypothetical protein
MWRERPHDEELDRERLYLLNEREQAEESTTIAEHEPDERRTDLEQLRVEAGA